MSKRPYDPSTVALLHPELGETVFREHPSPDSVALGVEAARLAYIRTEASAAELKRLKDALGFAGYADVQTFDHPSTDGQGYGAVGKGRILLAFRGTQSDRPTDIVTDASTTLRQWSEPPGSVHKGFARTALGLWEEDVKPWLEKLPKGQALTICGHSLGAAIATLLACKAHDLVQAESTDLITIGSPRVGDEPFATGVSKKVRITRIVNCCDIVTQIPPFLPGVLPVVHAGPQLYINRNGDRVDEPNPAADQLAAHAEYLIEHTARFGTVPTRGLADHAPANYLRAFYS